MNRRKLFKMLSAAIIGASSPTVLAVKPKTHMLSMSDLRDAWPIGSIFETISPVHPENVFGFGTWVSFGAGRVLITEDVPTHTHSTNQEHDHTHEFGSHTHSLNSPSEPYVVVHRWRRVA